MDLARPARPSTAVLLALALVSAAGLAFEITLTRIFSLVFQYHYAFLAVSLAILGLGLGAALGAWLPARGATRLPARRSGPAARATPAVPLAGARPIASRAAGPASQAAAAAAPRVVTATPSSAALVASALAVAYLTSAFLLAQLPLGGPLWLRVGSALPPFILTGLFSALIFAGAPGQSGSLYAADLVGAAGGAAGALALMTPLGAFNIAIALGIAAALAALALALLTPRLSPTAGERPRVRAPLFTLLLATAFFAISLCRGGLDLTAAGLAAAPRDKTMAHLLADPAQGARIVYTAWDPFARVDVVETHDPTAKLVFTDGGAGSYMLRFDGDLAPLAPLRDTVEFLPFASGPTARTLVVGAGAGKDVLLALLGGAREISALEVNPAMVAATRRFAAYNGGILDRPEVRLCVGDARTFVERDRAAYDLIYLNLVYTQAAEPAGQALVEGYLFTRQAFRACLARLAPGGRLAVVSHSALEGSRAALTALAALADAGEPLPQATRHLALLMLPMDDPTLRQTVLVVGREPLTPGTVAALQHGASRLGLVPLFLPGVSEATLAPLVQGASLDSFLAADPTYDLRPVGDDRPFFFKLDPGLPAPLAQALGGAAALAALLALVAWRPARRQGWAAALGCVALIGTGYMLFEVALIQRLHLLLGQPALATATVLGGLLAGGAAGSFLSQRWPEKALGRHGVAALLGVVTLGLAGWLALPALVAALLPAGLAWRALAAASLAALMGVPLGIPFPSALRLAGGRGLAATPLLWAVNGAFSALGASLAVALSVTWGFAGAVVGGVIAYLLAAGLWRRV